MKTEPPIDVVLLPGSVSRRAGGLYTSVRRLSESLDDQGNVCPHVVGNRDENTEQDLSQWRKKPILLNAMNRSALATELYRWLQVHDPDLVHPQFLWSYSSMATLRWRQQDSRRRHLVSPRGMLDPWAIRHSRWKKRIAGLLFETKHLRKAACIHALCENEAQSIRKLGLNNPICVIPNGIDVPSNEELDRLKFVPLEDGESSPCINSPSNDSVLTKAAATELRSRGRKEIDGRRTLLYVGRIHPKKGLLHVIQAWKQAQQDLVNCRLVIAGWDDGDYQQTLSQAIDELMLKESITLVGSIYGQPKAIALARADTFILPSLSEGLPMAVLEAWAYRLPVLMTPQCNLAIGFQSKSAMRIETDVRTLADGLREWANTSDAMLDEMGNNGRRLVQSQFQWNHIALQMTQVYHWILGQGDKPSCVIPSPT